MKSGIQDGLRSFERKQIAVSILALVFMVGLSVIYTFLYRSGQAEESARLISRMIQIQDRREAILTLQSARLDHFRVIRFVSPDREKSFTLPELSDLMGGKGAWDSFVHGTVTIPIEAAGGASSQLVFEFNRFAYVPWAVLIWLVFNGISIPQTRIMRRRIVAQYERELEMDKQVSRMEIANVVRHNIRTPLSALMRLADTVRFRNQEEAEIFQSVILQIRSLISKLDSKPQEAATLSGEGFHGSLQLVLLGIQHLLPKGILLDAYVDDSIPSVLIRYVEAELKSIVENLVNNSVEALGNSGEIRVTARDMGHSVLVEVEDNGPGISEEIIGRVTEKNFSFGKPKGTGLGLYHARQCLRDWGGDLQIFSKPGAETKVVLRFPIQGRQPWYTARVKISKSSTVVVVDDQVSIHRLLKIRLDEVGFVGRIISFYDAESFRRGVTEIPDGDLTVFMDYDFEDSQQNGIDLLREIPPSSGCYLVTGHFDDPAVMGFCSANKIPLIPKTGLHELPFVLAD